MGAQLPLCEEIELQNNINLKGTCFYYDEVQSSP